MFTTLVLGVGQAAFAASPTDAVWNLDATFRDYEIVALNPDLTKADLADGSFSLSLFGKRYDLNVSTPDWYQGPLQIAELGADGSVRMRPPAYQSVVKTGVGVDSAVQALIMVDAPGVAGHVRDDGHVIALQPLSLLRPGAPAGLSVVYRTSDIVNQELPHLHGSVPTPGDLDLPVNEPGDEGVGGPDRRITLWADSQMAAQPGFATTISNARATMSFEYSSGAAFYPGWAFSVVNNAIYTCFDAACDNAWGMSSTNPFTLIVQWGTQVPNNAPVGTNFDTASLSTGKNFGGILGLGYQPGRYNINAMPGLPSWSQALLLGHENGHNFNGDHGNRGTPTPGRATSSTHNHPFNHCHLEVPLLGCLQNHQHDNFFTHYTLMWPSLQGNQGNSEQFFDLGSANQFWMRACNNNGFSGGSYTVGSGAGFGGNCFS